MAYIHDDETWRNVMSGIMSPEQYESMTSSYSQGADSYEGVDPYDAPYQDTRRHTGRGIGNRRRRSEAPMLSQRQRDEARVNDETERAKADARKRAERETQAQWDAYYRDAAKRAKADLRSRAKEIGNQVTGIRSQMKDKRNQHNTYIASLDRKKSALPPYSPQWVEVDVAMRQAEAKFESEYSELGKQAAALEFAQRELTDKAWSINYMDDAFREEYKGAFDAGRDYVGEQAEKAAETAAARAGTAIDVIKKLVNGTVGAITGTGAAQSPAPAQAKQEPATPTEGEQAQPAKGEQAATAEGEQAAPAEGEQAATAEGEQAATAEGEQAATAEGEQAATAEGEQAATAEGEQAAPAEGEQAAPAEGEQAQQQPAQQQQQAQAQQQGQQQQNGLTGTLTNVLGSYFGARLGNSTVRNGLDPSGVSASNRRVADLMERGAADYQKAAQRNMQIANQNYRDEAEKNAASKGAAENAQNVANYGNASAGAAALARKPQAAEYEPLIERSDARHDVGLQDQIYGNDMQQKAEGSRAEAKIRDFTAAQTAQRNEQVDMVSEGPKEELPKVEIPKEDPPEPDPPEPDPPEPDPQDILKSTNVQNVMNFVLGYTSSWRKIGESKPTNDEDFIREEKERVLEFIKYYCDNVAKDSSIYENLLPRSNDGKQTVAQYTSGSKERSAFWNWVYALQQRKKAEADPEELKRKADYTVPQ